MSRQIVLILTAAALVSACDHRNMSDTTTHRGGKAFLALGDSYTIGESVPERDRWPMQLAELLRRDGASVSDPKIIARTGWTTDELSGAIDAEQLDGQAFELVTLLIGVNNQYRGRSSAEYRTQFVELLHRSIKFTGNRPARVIVLSIPDWGVTRFAEGRDRAKIGREIDEFNSIARDETTRADAHFVDITPISRSSPQLVAGDGLHPSAEAYARWAAAALSDAKSALSSK